MVIAIQHGLENIKRELENRGNEVFYIEENKIADAVLYSEVDTYPYHTINNTSAAVLSNGNASYGALLVNVTNKSLEEIIHILEKRVYSPLFWKD